MVNKRKSADELERELDDLQKSLEEKELESFNAEYAFREYKRAKEYLRKNKDPGNPMRKHYEDLIEDSKVPARKQRKIANLEYKIKKKRAEEAQERRKKSTADKETQTDTDHFHQPQPRRTYGERPKWNAKGRSIIPGTVWPSPLEKGCSR